jgi:lysozyme
MINDEGLAIVKKYEGLVDGDPDTPGLDPYLDPINIATIGWGSCWSFNGSRITMDHRSITINEAEHLLRRYCLRAEGSIGRLVKVPLTSNQRSALISFVYNVGSGNFQRSSARMKLNRFDYEGAANEFWKWRRAGGRILRGLVARRKSEARLFRTVSQKASPPLGHPLTEVFTPSGQKAR